MHFASEASKYASMRPLHAAFYSPPWLTASLTTWSNGLKTVLKSFLE
jgi:hypothetical protein